MSGVSGEVHQYRASVWLFAGVYPSAYLYVEGGVCGGVAQRPAFRSVTSSWFAVGLPVLPELGCRMYRQAVMVNVKRRIRRNSLRILGTSSVLES